MKRLISIIISTLLILSIAVVPAYAADNDTLTSADGLYDYRMINSTDIEILKFNGFDENETYNVPSEIDGFTVRWLGEYAFTNYDGLEYRETPRIKAETIVIPDTVTYIGNYAFASSHAHDWSLMTLKAKHITIPDSVICIGDYAFNECYYLTDITVPDSVKKIGKGAFCGCFNLESANLGNGITEIPDKLFMGCMKLSSFKMGYKQTAIGDYAFFNCLGLGSITINTKTELGKYCFGYDHNNDWDDEDDQSIYYPHARPSSKRRPGETKLIIKLDSEEDAHISVFDITDYARECDLPLYLRIDDENIAPNFFMNSGVQAKILYNGKTVKGWKSSKAKAVKITDSGKFSTLCSGTAVLSCKIDNGNTLKLKISSASPYLERYVINYSGKKPALNLASTSTMTKIKKGKSVKFYVDGRIPNSAYKIKTSKHIKITAKKTSDIITVTGKKKGTGTAKITVNGGYSIKLKVKVI